MKKTIISLVLIFIGWAVINFLVHGMYLMETYEKTSHLWRPMAEMKAAHMQVANLIVAIGFILIYQCLVTTKSMKNALCYGAMFGVVQAVGMGLGTYSYMPIEACLAFTWGWSELAKYLLGGLILGLCCKAD